MFFSLILENAAGDQIGMTATANQYMASQIEGFKPSMLEVIYWFAVEVMSIR